MTSNPLGEDASSPELFNVTLDAHAQLPGLQWAGGDEPTQDRPADAERAPPKAQTGLEELETWLLSQGVKPRHAFHAKQKTRPVLSQAEDGDEVRVAPAFIPLTHSFRLYASSSTQSLSATSPSQSTPAPSGSSR